MDRTLLEKALINSGFVKARFTDKPKYMYVQYFVKFFDFFFLPTYLFYQLMQMGGRNIADHLLENCKHLAPTLSDDRWKEV